MTTDYRAMCAELLAALKSWSPYGGGPLESDEAETEACLINRARAALAEHEPEGPTDEELYGYWISTSPELGCADPVGFARAVLARWGRPTPQPVWAEIHYAWELEDADGEWQAGGSANNLDDVQREGNRYLQTYSKDGPHKLIIQRHCVITIKEVTNDHPIPRRAGNAGRLLGSIQRSP